MRYEAFSVGDVLRAAPSGLNWVIESNGTSGSVTTAGAGNAQGPGGGEYYYQDNYAAMEQLISIIINKLASAEPLR